MASALAHNVETLNLLKERDLYLRLLNLGPQTECAPFLEGALRVIGDVTDATRQFQAQFIRDALEDAGWNVVEAARRLDIARSHLYRLMNAFGIERSPK